MKNFIANHILPIFTWPIRQFSPKIRARIFKELIRLACQPLSPKKNLKFLLELENHLYTLESGVAKSYGKGIHPKHKHTKYHQFFIEHLKSRDRVLDIGCGNGIVAYDIVKRIPGIRITGIDLAKENIEFANKHYQHSNLNFIHGNALKSLPDKSFDVIILSNVLEHIKNRIDFLRKIIKNTQAKRLLIRVPLFERDWRVPLKKELKVDYRLDSTHHHEYTQESFQKELKKAELKVMTMEIRWGEIWSVVSRSNKDA